MAALVVPLVASSPKVSPYAVVPNEVSVVNSPGIHGGGAYSLLEGETLNLALADLDDLIIP